MTWEPLASAEADGERAGPGPEDTDAPTSEAGAGYDAATTSVAIRDRSHRAQWAFTGRAPTEMLKGVVTGVMPEPPKSRSEGVWGGRATYHTVLTPKGRIVGDLWLWREEGEAEVLRAHVPAAAAEPLRTHFARVLPPRLARLEDRTGEVGMLTVAGPHAGRLCSSVVLGLRVDAGELDTMQEGEFRLLAGHGGDRVLVARCADLPVPAFDVVAERPVTGSIWKHLAGAGAVPLDRAAWEALRVEAGRPAFGPELGPEVIPVEAGIHHRAIDYGKGCYTGQEVIVRIRDRGRVNRHLRRLVLDPAAELPEPGTPLFGTGDREQGRITTAVASPGPRPLALAYVRREVAPGEVVRVGDPGGPEARVEEIAG